MIPLPEKPKIVLQVSKTGQVLAFADNISVELEIVATDSEEIYAEESKGLPFNNDLLILVPTVDKLVGS